MIFGSLFTGIGMIDYGLEHAGMRCRWQVENDPDCIAVLEQHWPNVTRYGDIRMVDASKLEPVDLIAGGFPCQDVSNAGRMAGINGSKSGLWSEFKRIIRGVRPRFVLVENVTGLLSRGMGDVLSDLSESGYDAEWQTIPASAFGAPHKRERVFILAYPAGLRLDRLPIFSQAVSDGGKWKPASGCWSGMYCHANSGRVFKIPDNGIVALDDGDSVKLAGGCKVRMIGNSVVWPVVEWLGRLVIEADRECSR